MAVVAEEGRVEASNRRIVTVALMLAMSVAALEQTVVSTAMPTITAHLGVEMEDYSWVFSSYLLAATVSTPLYGKLADILGRKRILLFGLGLFGLGSMLSGMSVSMPMLIGMRVVQGLGAGAVMPIVLTLLGDIYSLDDRAKVQGWFSGVWGVSSLAGPSLGGVLTDQLSWRWVFYVTVPFGIVAAWVLARKVHERVERKESPPIDWAGAGLLATGSTVLLVAVLGGAERPWAWTAALLGAVGVLLVLFVLRERRAADPVLPLDLLTRPMIAAAILGSFVIGGMLFGIDTYIPLYVQGVLGGTATNAGRTITPLFVTWSISVAIAARVVVRFGFRATAVVGSTFIAAGSAALVAGAHWPERSGPLFFGGMVVMGLGMGPTSLSYILGVQCAVPWERRGAATAAVTFFRTIGGALIVGLLGATLGYALTQRLADLSGPAIHAREALDPALRDHLPPASLSAVRHALGLTLRDVFLQMLALALLGMACAWPLQGGRTKPSGKPDPLEDEQFPAAIPEF